MLELGKLEIEYPFVEDLQGALDDKEAGIFSFQLSGWAAGRTESKTPLVGIGVKISKKEIPAEYGYQVIQRTLFGKPAVLKGPAREVRLQ